MTSLNTPDDALRPALSAIGESIGYGRACQILGELWDEKLERDYGMGTAKRGAMEVRKDIDRVEALRAGGGKWASGMQAIVGATLKRTLIGRILQMRGMELARRADAEAEALTATVRGIRSLIASDAHAMSFQSMGQYRSALLSSLSAIEQATGSVV